MGPVGYERKPYDIPHDRVLRNHEIKSVAFFRPSGAWRSWPLQPTVQTVGYCRSSLAGLQNGVRLVESLFALVDKLEARLTAAQRQARPDEALRRRLNALMPSLPPAMDMCASNFNG